MVECLCATLVYLSSSFFLLALRLRRYFVYVSLLWPSL